MRGTKEHSHRIESTLAALALALAAPLAAVLPALPQDMLRYLDLNSEAFTRADMTRTEIEAALAVPAGTVDLSGKRLNGLDLSGLDLRRATLQSARLNRTRLAGANLDGVN